MTALREAAQQALEALINTTAPKNWEVITALKTALAEPVLQTCNCRWDGEMQMQQCTLHEAHVDAIKEWAQRAKFAEKKLAALAEPAQEPVAFAHINGTSDTKWHPPQRKPLTEEEIYSLFRTVASPVMFARAIERAHGIGGDE